MKKYLLGALLVIGATSFAAVAVPVTGSGSGSDGTAKADLPVKVVGTVLDNKTSKVLVITPLKNAGVSGGSLEFDFGNLVEGQNQQLDGTFKVEVMGSGKPIALNTEPTVVLVGGKAVGNDNKKATVNIGTVDPTNADDVTLTYALTNLVKQADNSYLGGLTVDAKVKTDAKAGSFVDRTIGVQIGVTGVTTTI